MITNLLDKQSYAGNGSNRNFAIPFTIVVNDVNEVGVILRDITVPAAPVDTLQVYGALQNYILTGANPPGTPFNTTVQMNVAPTANQIIVVYRKMPFTQLLNMVTNNFDFSNLNVVHDRIVAMIQVLSETIDRAPRLLLSSQTKQPNFISEPQNGSALGWNLGSWVWYAVGAVNNAIGTLVGDVTSPGGLNATTTIAPNAVTNAKAAQVPGNTLKGNNTGSTANIMDLTVAQVQALLTSLDGPTLLQNLGLSTSVGSSQMTINVLTKALGTPSATSPVNAAFRDVAPGVGDYIVRQVTGSLSLIIPSGGTLGTTSAAPYYLYLYLIDNAGALLLGAAGSYLDEGSVQSSTAISASSTASNVLYATSSVLNKAIRLIGRIQVTEATAGIWATNAAEISTVGNFKKPNGSKIVKSLSSGIFTFTSGPNALLDSGGINPITVSINADGGDVEVGLMSDQLPGSSVISPANVFADNTGGLSSVQVAFLMDGVIFDAVQMGMQTNGTFNLMTIPPRAFSTVHAPPPGPHTYTCQVTTGNNRGDTSVQNCVLYARPY